MFTFTDVKYSFYSVVQQNTLLFKVVTRQTCSSRCLASRLASVASPTGLHTPQLSHSTPHAASCAPTQCFSGKALMNASHAFWPLCLQTSSDKCALFQSVQPSGEWGFSVSHQCFSATPLVVNYKCWCRLFLYVVVMQRFGPQRHFRNLRSICEIHFQQPQC